MIKVYFKNGTIRDFKISRFKVERQSDSSSFQILTASGFGRRFNYELVLNLDEISAIVGSEQHPYTFVKSFHVYLKNHEATTVDAHSFDVVGDELRFFWHPDGQINTDLENKKQLENVYFCASEVLAVEFDDSEN
jgi:hypothetical protein